MKRTPRTRKPTPQPIAGTAAARRGRRTIALTAQPDSALCAEAHARGWRLVHLEHFGGALPGGLAIHGALIDVPIDDPRAAEMLPLCPAVVRLGTAPSAGDRRAPAVLCDLAAEGRLAAEHFAERGFRHVSYIGSRPMQVLAALFESFRDRATALKMTCHLHQVAIGSSGDRPAADAARKQRAFTDWLRGVPKPMGLLAPTDGRAVRYALWAAGAGFNLPADVAVLGRGNDVGICESMTPTLSSIDPDAGARTYAACELLARLMAGEPPPSEPIVVPPAGIAERESTHQLAVPDRDVAAALRHLWDHLDENLSVDDVALEVGVARRTLERAFRRHLGRGINDELRRKRLEELCRLLRATDRPVADLAPAVGFRNLANLYKAFHAAYGMTPRKFRIGSGE